MAKHKGGPVSTLRKVSRFVLNAVFKMSAAELDNIKKELTEWINTLTDDSLVGVLNAVKLSYEGNDSDWWEQLSLGEKRNILEGVKDYEQGSIIDSEEFWKSLVNERDS